MSMIENGCSDGSIRSIMDWSALVLGRCLRLSGGELGSTGWMKCEWRVVVGQLATLKADHTSSIAEGNFAMAA